MSLLDLLLILADDQMVALVEEGNAEPDYVGAAGEIYDLLSYQCCIISHHITFEKGILCIEYVRLCGFV